VEFKRSPAYKNLGQQTRHLERMARSRLIWAMRSMAGKHDSRVFNVVLDPARHGCDRRMVPTESPNKDCGKEIWPHRAPAERGLRN
jgi:hypothetical protein